MLGIWLLGIWLLVGPAAALTWWVEDAAEAEAVAAALESLWPEHPIALEVGGPPAPQTVAAQGREGIWKEDDRLFVAWDGPPALLAEGADPETQVAMVRSWSRSLDAPLPPPTASAPPPAEPSSARPVQASPPDPEPTGPRAQPSLSWMGGPASRWPGAYPASHFTAEARWGGERARIGPALSLDPGETASLIEGGAIRIQRLGAELAPSWTIPLQDGWSAELGVGAGIRVLHARDIQGTSTRDIGALPTGSARARLWSSPPGATGSVGFGLACSRDGLPGERFSYALDGGRAEARPWTLAAEIGARRP